MTNSIWEIVADTPWWVYVLFAFLVRVGLQATKARVISARKLLTIPLIFISLSFFNMYSNTELTIDHVAIWMSALCAGGLLGWLQYKALKIQAVKNTTSLYMPGTWSLLVIILTMFTIRYYIGYQNAVSPQLFAEPKTWIIFLYGIFTGLFAGRSFYALRCIKTGPYVSDELLAKATVK